MAKTISRRWWWLKASTIGGKNVRGIEGNMVATQWEPLARIGQLIGGITPFALLWLLLWYLYRNKTFIRI